MLWRLLLVVALVSAAGFAADADAARAESHTVRPTRGVNIYFSRHDASDPAAVDALMIDLVRMNVDTVLITYPVYIDSIFGNDIGPKYEADERHPYAASPTFEDLRVAIASAHAHDLTVWLRPLLDERILGEELAGGWRGNISPSDPELFFANYTRMLIDLVNQVDGVEWIAIGTELTSLQLPVFDAGWSRLIALLRATPHSPRLFYAVNWDAGQSPATSPWFGELDGLGIDAYFPARNVPADAPADVIAVALAEWLPRLEELRSTFPHLPLFVSEVGASSSRLEPSVIEQPWYADPAAEVDLDAQARYAEAACALYTSATRADGAPLVDGMFWWRTSVHLLEQPAADPSHEFRGKPVQAVIATCFAEWSEAAP